MTSHMTLSDYTKYQWIFSIFLNFILLFYATAMDKLILAENITYQNKIISIENKLYKSESHKISTYMFVSLFVCPSVCQSDCLFVCLSIFSTVSVIVYFSSVIVSFCLTVGIFVSVSLSHSAFQPIQLSI